MCAFTPTSSMQAPFIVNTATNNGMAINVVKNEVASGKSIQNECETKYSVCYTKEHVTVPSKSDAEISFDEELYEEGSNSEEFAYVIRLRFKM
ncbi:hypothetical protein AB6A40_005829 [Gnathostoma spinigerum]|uniref:Uncharacterized protein n=1 Tax=Gnathostoma spinigerum TaxID=75299 RepID=A0ABD6EHR1_9BILA